MRVTEHGGLADVSLISCAALDNETDLLAGARVRTRSRITRFQPASERVCRQDCRNDTVRGRLPYWTLPAFHAGHPVSHPRLRYDTVRVEASLELATTDIFLAP